jgi:hypothetical protein
LSIGFSGAPGAAAGARQGRRPRLKRATTIRALFRGRRHGTLIHKHETEIRLRQALALFRFIIGKEALQPAGKIE